MNEDIIKGKWKQLKGVLRQQWGKLTDSDYEEIAGSKDKLIGRLQERYGYARDQAEREVRDFEGRQDQSAPQSGNGGVPPHVVS